MKTKAALLLILLVGCSTEEIARWRLMKTPVEQELEAVQKTAQDAQREADRLRAAATQPGITKEQQEAALRAAKEIDEIAKRMSATIPVLLTKLQSIDAGLDAVQQKNAEALAAATSGALAGVPGVGAYAGIIGIVVGGAFGMWQRMQKAKADAARLDARTEAAGAMAESTQLRDHIINIVKSIEAAAPEPSPDEKVMIAAIQGTSTTEFVHEIKSEVLGQR